MARDETTGTAPALRARPYGQLLGVCLVALATANCAKNTQRYAAGPSGNGIDPKYGVRASPRLYNEGDVIPKGGGRRFSGKPYVVAGRTYYPREDAKGYVREGLVSWYGSAFHGRMTANGEVFDRHSIAAAHPTLPLPSYARVTNLNNGYSMVVRVNDRGPYHANRLMDVSEEVARALDFHRKGTERVRVEYVGKASIAGSDDRKLMATLRADGRPGSGAPVMVADLRSNEAEPDTERFSRPARPALAFRPPEDAEDAAGSVAAAPPVRRPAPVVVAAATAPVHPAVQPTASRATAFRPAPVMVADLSRYEKPAMRTATAAAPPRNAPLSLAPPPMRLAGAAPERTAAGAKEGGARLDRTVTAQAGPRTGSASNLLPKPAAPPVHLAASPAAPAMPAASKLAMARLVAASAPSPKPATVTPAAKPAPRRSQFAGMY